MTLLEKTILTSFKDFDYIYLCNKNNYYQVYIIIPEHSDYFMELFIKAENTFFNQMSISNIEFYIWVSQERDPTECVPFKNSKRLFKK